MLLRSLTQKKLRKSIHETPSYANFFYICASKPVGRKDPSRFERVDIRLHSFFKCVKQSKFTIFVDPIGVFKRAKLTDKLKFEYFYK